MGEVPDAPVPALPHSLLRWRTGSPFAVLRTDGPLVFVLLAMVALGIFLRAYHLNQPASLKWDEHHYVETARSYLAHKYAWNDHPPLSKLIIAGFMWVLGDGPLAWRLPSFLFGVVNIALIAALAHHIFRSKRAALIAAAFVAADGLFIAYSRTALLDGMLVAFSLAAMLSILKGRTASHVILAGFCAGCAVSFKLSGLVFVFGSTGACLASPKLRRYAPLLLLTAGLVFYAQFAFALANVGRSGSLSSVILENQAMVKNHLSYTVVHPFSSKWYTWFLPLRPIFVRRDADIDGSVRALLTLGNPLLWWAGTLAVVTAAQGVVQVGARRLWRKLVHAPSNSRAVSTFWVLACYAGPLIFWLPGLRDSYIYHYLPSYAFALPLLAGWVNLLYQKHRFWVLVAILLVAEVSVVYAPLWAELPLSPDALNQRLLPIWR